jgi:hypothetical protein
VKSWRIRCEGKDPYACRKQVASEKYRSRWDPILLVRDLRIRNQASCGLQTLKNYARASPKLCKSIAASTKFLGWLLNGNVCGQSRDFEWIGIAS